MRAHDKPSSDVTGVLVRINQDRDVCADSTVGRCRNVTFYKAKEQSSQKKSPQPTP